MSVSVVLRGICPPDEYWKKMKAIWDSCVAAQVTIPSEVAEFFGGTGPDSSGVVMKLGEGDTGYHKCVKIYKAEMCDGFEVDITKVPDHVTILRFYASF